jgi:magnesium chelatase family protein
MTLPDIPLAEALEIACIPRAAGFAGRHTTFVTSRPFRARHHTISDVGLIGGGPGPRPGEVSLTHQGVLWLDALPGFRLHALEGLRQPLEKSIIKLS